MSPKAVLAAIAVGLVTFFAWLGGQSGGTTPTGSTPDSDAVTSTFATTQGQYPQAPQTPDSETAASTTPSPVDQSAAEESGPTGTSRWSSPPATPTTTQAGPGAQITTNRGTGLDSYTTALLQAQATAFMKAYARPPVQGPSRYAWWSNVEPYLTPAAVARMKSTDPMSVRFARVTGPAAIPAGQAPSRYRVTVPTDQGTWQVVLIRASDERLLVDQLTATP